MKVESYGVKCPECHGQRYVGNNLLCPVCHGDGAIVIKPARSASAMSREKLWQMFWAVALLFVVLLVWSLWP